MYLYDIVENIIISHNQKSKMLLQNWRPLKYSEIDNALIVEFYIYISGALWELCQVSKNYLYKNITS